jgi:DNA-binding response OmpR family regulator
MPAPAPLHAVVMDDALELLPLYEEVLSEEGFRVTLLGDVSADAGEILRLDPDLIVLDLLVAHENRGLPFLRLLRDDPAGADVPVIVCSAANDALHQLDDEIRQLNAALLSKPFDIDRLLTQARDSVAKGRQVR